jgi:hypothetical protein
VERHDVDPHPERVGDRLKAREQVDEVGRDVAAALGQRAHDVRVRDVRFRRRSRRDAQPAQQRAVLAAEGGVRVTEQRCALEVAVLLDPAPVRALAPAHDERAHVALARDHEDEARAEVGILATGGEEVRDARQAEVVATLGDRADVLRLGQRVEDLDAEVVASEDVLGLAGEARKLVAGDAAGAVHGHAQSLGGGHTGTSS